MIVSINIYHLPFNIYHYLLFLKMQGIDKIVFFSNSHQNINLKSAARDVLKSGGAIANFGSRALKNVAEIFGRVFLEKRFQNNLCLVLPNAAKRNFLGVNDQF